MKKHVLIYDDEEEILFLCKAILSRHDFVVETFSKCENIFSEIDSFHPDLILMDLWIPEMGGEKAVEMIKQNDNTKEIPVLLFSANADIKEICNKVHANGYIEKPFNVSYFIETIKNQVVD